MLNEKVHVKESERIAKIIFHKKGPRHGWIKKIVRKKCSSYSMLIVNICHPVGYYILYGYFSPHPHFLSPFAVRQ